MEPVYVDNLSTAINAFWQAFMGTVQREDVNFRIATNGEEMQKWRTAMALASQAMGIVFVGLGIKQPRYCHIWVDEEKRLVPTFPKDATREELMNMCHVTNNFLAMMPVGQQEAKDILG